MQCVDCHNRPAHAFELPDRAVDDAVATGQLPSGLPFLKKTGVDLIKADYKSEEEAEQKIPASLVSFYRQKYPDVYGKRAADIQAAGQVLLAIYKRNVFPDSRIRNPNQTSFMMLGIEISGPATLLLIVSPYRSDYN
jgi:hypothetical protein